MRRKLLRVLAVVVILAAAIFYAFVVWPLRNPHPQPLATQGLVAVEGATIYVSPDRPPLREATLVAQDGRILRIGPHIEIPAAARRLPCHSCTVTAGFWNTHIHFTQPKWQNAAFVSAATLNAQLADMLTSRGFTTVVDLGSDPRVTVSLRRRIETGDLRGPFVYTAGPALYPQNGIPFYLRETTGPLLRKMMPQPDTPEEAVASVRRNFDRGSDVLKLFTGSYVQRGTIQPMREDIARAAVAEARRHHAISFTHPSNLEGVRVALASGVDVLAHTPDTPDGLDEPFIEKMAGHAAMVPTLKMFATTVTRKRSYLDPIDDVVRRFHRHGGTLLFGTDVGYMRDYSTGEEFAALARCGLTSTDILRMLTTAPAERLGVAAAKGTLETGKSADFVILRSDPAASSQAFSDVQTTVRSGAVIWQAGR